MMLWPKEFVFAEGLKAEGEGRGEPVVLSIEVTGGKEIK